MISQLGDVGNGGRAREVCICLGVDNLGALVFLAAVVASVDPEVVVQVREKAREGKLELVDGLPLQAGPIGGPVDHGTGTVFNVVRVTWCGKMPKVCNYL